MQVKSILMTAGRVGVICSTLACCAFAKDTCNTETFKGPYALTVTGFVLPPLATGEFGFVSFGGTAEGAVPLQGVQLITSDGKGNLTDKESLSLNGEPLAATMGVPPFPFSLHYGTYTVDSDCTGTAFLTNAKYICPTNPGTCPNASFVTLAFIINKSGAKIRMVGVPPYDTNGLARVVSSIGDRIDDDRDSHWGDDDRH